MKVSCYRAFDIVVKTKFLNAFTIWTNVVPAPTSGRDLSHIPGWLGQSIIASRSRQTM